MLRPLAPAAAAILPGDRAGAERILAAALDREWPLPDILDLLPAHAASTVPDGRYGIWAIIELATGVVVGYVGFLGPQDVEGCLEIGYSIVPSRRRKGYATEAAGRIIDWAFRRLRAPGIVAGTDPDNAASHRTLERLAFVRTGTSRGEIWWRRDRPGTTA